MSNDKENQGLKARDLVPAERLAGIARGWFRNLDSWTLFEIATLVIVASITLLVIGYVLGAVASTLLGAAATTEVATGAWANPVVAIVLLASSLISWHEAARSCELVHRAGTTAADSRNEVTLLSLKVRRSRRLGTASLVLSLVTVVGALALLIADAVGPDGEVAQPFQYVPAIASFLGTVVVVAASAITVSRLRSRSEAVVA